MTNHVQKALTVGVNVDYDDVWIDDDGDVCWIDGIAAMWFKDFNPKDIEQMVYSFRWMILE